MTSDRKKTDVVIIGLGAVGGVAALPLTRAGLDVVGLEAGSWLTPRDFAPHELRNNFRGWPLPAIDLAHVDLMLITLPRRRLSGQLSSALTPRAARPAVAASPVVVVRDPLGCGLMDSARSERSHQIVGSRPSIAG